MDFGEILSRAWRIIWTHKILWIFGILAGCSQAGSSAGSNSSYRFSNNELGTDIERYFNQLDPNVLVLLIVAGVFLLLVLWLVAIFLGTIGRIGLIRGTVQAESGAGRLIFGELFSGSMPYFWKVFLLGLVVGILTFLAFILLAVPVAICTLGVGLLCLIPIAWLIQVLVEQASNAIVIENLGVMDGLRRGWEVMTKNLGQMIVMGLILYLGVSFIVGLIIGLPLLLVLGPVLAATVTSQSFDPQSILPSGGLLVAGLCFVAYLPVLLVLSGILRSYISTSWTLTYLRLTHTPAPAEPLEPLPSPM